MYCSTSWTRGFPHEEAQAILLQPHGYGGAYYTARRGASRPGSADSRSPRSGCNQARCAASRHREPRSPPGDRSARPGHPEPPPLGHPGKPRRGRLRHGDRRDYRLSHRDFRRLLRRLARQHLDARHRHAHGFSLHASRPGDRRGPRSGPFQRAHSDIDREHPLLRP